MIREWRCAGPRCRRLLGVVRDGRLVIAHRGREIAVEAPLRIATTCRACGHPNRLHLTETGALATIPSECDPPLASSAR